MKTFTILVFIQYLKQQKEKETFTFTNPRPMMIPIKHALLLLSMILLGVRAGSKTIASSPVTDMGEDAVQRPPHCGLHPSRNDDTPDIPPITSRDDLELVQGKLHIHMNAVFNI